MSNIEGDKWIHRGEKHGGKRKAGTGWPNIQVSSETLRLLHRTEGAMQLATGRKYTHDKCIAEMCKQIIFVTEENVQDHMRPIKLKDEST